MTLIHAGQAVAVAAALLAAPLTAASAANAVTADATQRLPSQVLGDPGGPSQRQVPRRGGRRAPPKNGANVHQWTCINGQANQEWNFVATSDGYYTLRATHSGKCLDVTAPHRRRRERRPVDLPARHQPAVAGPGAAAATSASSPGTAASAWTSRVPARRRGQRPSVDLPDRARRNQEWRLA